MIRWLPVLACAWLMLMAVVSTSRADADSRLVSEERKAEAQRYFERGNELFGEGDYVAAADAFEKAYETAPHPTVLVNMAISYDRAKMFPQAVVTYRKYLAEALSPKSDKALLERLEELLLLVGEIHVSCSITPCELVVDGAARIEGPQTLVLSPGKHEVRGFAGGRQATLSVVVFAGKQGSIELVFDEVTAPSVPSPNEEQAAPVDEPSRFRLRVPFWIASGVAVAAGVSTVVLGVKTNQAEDEFNAGGRVDGELKDRGIALRRGTNVSIAVCAVAAATALGLAIYDATRDDGAGDLDLDDDAEGRFVDEAASRRPQFTVGAGPGFGLGAELSF